MSVLKQCLKRKRIDGIEDRINVYIKAKGGRSLNEAIRQNNIALEQISCLENGGEAVFRLVMYKKEICKAIDVTREGDDMFKVNKIMFYKLKWDNLKFGSIINGGVIKTNELMKLLIGC